MTPNETQGHMAPSVSEIEQAQSVFARARDAILDLAQLRQDVAGLRDTVNSMQADLDRLRNQNNALEEALTHSRQARHELETRNASLQRDLDEEKRNHDVAVHTRNEQQDRADRAERSLAEARKERDDAQLRVMELEDKLKASDAKLNELQETFRRIFGQIEQPKATPSPTQEMEQRIGHAQGSGQIAHDPEPVKPEPVEQYHGWDKPEPAAASTPEPEQPKRRIYEGEQGFSWTDVAHEAKFDEGQRRWYIEV